MDEILKSELPWELKLCIVLGCGLIVAILVLATPKRLLAWLGKNTPVTPNWLTLVRLPIFWAGVCTHLYQSPFWGFVVVVFAAALDRTDGKMAASFKEFDVIRSRKDIAIGEWLDPLIDKLTLLPLIAIMAHLKIVNFWLVAAIMIVDIFGTLMRKAVVTWFKKTIEPKLNGHLHDVLAAAGSSINGRMRKSKASAAGKIKALLQTFGLVACFPYELGWLRGHVVPNAIFVAALIFGVLSVLTRVKIHEEVDKVVDSTNAIFSHEES